MKTISEILENAQNKCEDAVGHVGYANYAEREREAMEWVADAFTELRKQLDTQKGLTNR